RAPRTTKCAFSLLPPRLLFFHTNAEHPQGEAEAGKFNLRVSSGTGRGRVVSASRFDRIRTALIHRQSCRLGLVGDLRPSLFGRAIDVTHTERTDVSFEICRR